VQGVAQVAVQYELNIIKVRDKQFLVTRAMAQLSISLVKLDRPTRAGLPFMTGASIPSGLKG
jgi:hypothetical protein